MKPIISLLVLALMTGSASVNAQSTTKKAEKEVSKDATKAADKTAEVASKGKSAVVDKVYKDKEGPNGETIYIDAHSKYYWIDKKGHKQYIAKDKLKDKK